MIISNTYLSGFLMLSVILFISYLLLKYLKNVSKILEILFNIKIFFLLKKKKIIFIYLKY